MDGWLMDVKGSCQVRVRKALDEKLRVGLGLGLEPGANRWLCCWIANSLWFKEDLIHKATAWNTNKLQPRQYQLRSNPYQSVVTGVNPSHDWFGIHFQALSYPIMTSYLYSTRDAFISILAMLFTYRFIIHNTYCNDPVTKCSTFLRL